MFEPDLCNPGPLFPIGEESIFYRKFTLVPMKLSNSAVHRTPAEAHPSKIPGYWLFIFYRASCGMVAVGFQPIPGAELCHLAKF